jgi:hypothetical protein
LNRQIVLFGDAVRERGSAHGLAQITAEEMAKHTHNAFNSGVDVAIDQGQELLRELIPLAEWRESAAERAQMTDYAQSAADFLKTRREQLKDPDSKGSE